MSGFRHSIGRPAVAEPASALALETQAAEVAGFSFDEPVEQVLGAVAVRV